MENMIIERYAANSRQGGQRIRFKTELFGKLYYWMVDPTGEWYLANIGPKGEARPV